MDFEYKVVKVQLDGENNFIVDRYTSENEYKFSETRLCGPLNNENLYKGCKLMIRIIFDKNNLNKFYLGIQNLGDNDQVLILKLNMSKPILLDKSYKDITEFINEVYEYVKNIFFVEIDDSYNY